MQLRVLLQLAASLQFDLFCGLRGVNWGHRVGADRCEVLRLGDEVLAGPAEPLVTGEAGAEAGRPLGGDVAEEIHSPAAWSAETTWADDERAVLAGPPASCLPTRGSWEASRQASAVKVSRTTPQNSEAPQTQLPWDVLTR